MRMMKLVKVIQWLLHIMENAVGALLEPSSRTNQYGVNFKDDHFAVIL